MDDERAKEKKIMYNRAQVSVVSGKSLDHVSYHVSDDGLEINHKSSCKNRNQREGLSFRRTC